MMHRGPHRCECGRADEPAVASVSGTCSESTSAPLDHVAELAQLDVERRRPLRRHERVVRDDAHAERPRAPRDLAADPTDADQAERLAVQLDAR
jgi:hypothetical protein